MSKNWGKIGYTALSKSGNVLLVAIEANLVKNVKEVNGKIYGIVDLKDLEHVTNTPNTFADIMATSEN